MLAGVTSSVDVVLSIASQEAIRKRIYRLYKLEGLNLRSKRPRRSRSSSHRLGRIEVSKINQCWSMDFVADQLFDGRRFRALTVVDNYSRKCLNIYPGQSIKGEYVVRIMEKIKTYTSHKT